MKEEILNKINTILDKILEEREVLLFAIIRRADSEFWDIVISGKGIDNQENLEWISGLFSKALGKSDIHLFSRVLLLGANESFVKNLTRTFSFTKKSGWVELVNTRINNVFISYAYLFRSKIK